MKKMMAFLLAAALCLLAGACGQSSSPAPGPAPSGGNGTAPEGPAPDHVYTMKLANANAVGSIKDEVSLKFADLAREKSGGRIEIQVYSGGTLGDWSETSEGLSLGVVQIVIEGIGSLEKFSPKASFEAIPYTMKDYDHCERFWASDDAKKIMEDLGSEMGMKLLGPQRRGGRVVTSTVRFTTAEELNGLKIRVPNNSASIKLWQDLGASPTPLALTETFTALQQGTVAAQENPALECYSYAFYDVCPYLIKTNHTMGSDVFIFDQKYFESLPQDIQDILTEAADEAAAWRNGIYREQEEEIFRKFQEKGVEVIEPDLETFYPKVENFIDDYPHLQEIYDIIQKYAEA